MTAFRTICFAFALALPLSWLAGSSRVVAQEEAIDFSSQVRPILSDRCFHCHGPDADNQESEFRMDSEEALFEAIEPGDVDSSELHARIHSADPDEMMPPPDSNRSLSVEEKRILSLWIEQGAPYEGHWAFEAPQRAEVPKLATADFIKKSNWTAQQIKAWSGNPIDAFLARSLVKADLSPSAKADASTLLRRAALTLTGLLPPRDLQEKYQGNIGAEDRYEQAVDSLLDSMAYAERQTLRWLDASRFADTDGYQNDNPRMNWPWRDWVIQAYSNNMPFDQFTIEQLAGDMLPEATKLQKLASAFNRNHRQNNEGGALAAEFKVENVIDRVETTSTVFLGLTFGCARCHDHKYDPLSQREFFQLYGYFNNIGEKGIGRGTEANPIMKTVSPLLDIDPKWLANVLSAEKTMDAATPAFDERFKTWKEETSKLLANADAKAKQEKAKPEQENEKEKSEDDDKKDAEKSVAESGLESIAGLSDKIKELLRNKKRNKKQKQDLRNLFVKMDPEQSKLQQAFETARSEFRKRGGYRADVMVMSERKGKPTPSYLLDRGQYDQPIKDEELPRGVPQALIGEGKTQPKDRLELAKWIVSRDNPLTARVIVNRIWQEHFGIGLVKTVDDFGVQGEAPSHPELLDWLAIEFIESGWDIRAMHRLIVTSAAYQQSSKSTSDLRSKDPENRLLARGPRYRADGFAIRDIALQASGLLSDKIGGAPVKPYQPAGLWEVVAANAGTRYNVDKGQKLYRRSMYTYWKRAVNPPRQTIFDAGGREVCNVQVRRTNTPLQALVLLNDTTFVECARVLAEQGLSYDAQTDDQRLIEMYRRAIARPITDDRLAVLQETLDYFREHYGDLPEQAKELLANGEATSDSSLDPTEHAAMTAVAHVILNLDEFLTIE